MRKIILLCFLSFALAAQTKIESAKKLFEERKFAEASKILTPIKNDSPDYAEAQFYLGRIAFEAKKYDEAEDYFENAVEKNDKVADYHSWLGNTYGVIAQEANVIKQGMLAPKMKKEWEKAVALDPKDLDSRTSLIQFYLQAPGFMGGSVEKAKEVANQIIKIKPAEGHRQLGNVYFSEKKTAEAEKEYKEMVKADPAYVSAFANFYVREKKYDQAFLLFEDALKKSPDDMMAIYQIGKTSAISGQKLERGEECLKRYLAYKPKINEPSIAGANMRLAQVYEKKGKKADAKKLFEAALKEDNTLKEAKEGLERVSK
jgi:tetratricopeptide (TPR) repeat protein